MKIKLHDNTVGRSHGFIYFRERQVRVHDVLGSKLPPNFAKDYCKRLCREKSVQIHFLYSVSDGRRKKLFSLNSLISIQEKRLEKLNKLIFSPLYDPIICQ